VIEEYAKHAVIDRRTDYDRGVSFLPNLQDLTVDVRTGEYQSLGTRGSVVWRSTRE